MADNPFSALDQAGVNPFSQVPNANSETAPVQPVDAQASQRQASVAAIANLPVLGSPEDIYSAYTDLTKQYQALIDKGQVDQIHNDAANQQQASDVTALARLQSQTTDPALSHAAGLAVQYAVARDQKQRAQSALEDKTAQRIQDLAAAGDDTQANILKLNVYQGDAENVLRDSITKQLILQREVENAQVQHDQQPWFRDATDFLLGFVPIRKQWERGGVVNVDQGLKHWYDVLLSGQRVQNEADTLWALPPDQFADVVKNQLIPRVLERSSVFGYHDRSEELNTLSMMQHTPGALSTNFGDILDNAALIPVTKVAKLASIPGMLARAGAREEARNLVASAFTETLAKGPAEATAATGITTGQLIDNLLPSAVNPEVLPRTWRGKLMGSAAHVSIDESGKPIIKPFELPPSGGPTIPPAEKVGENLVTGTQHSAGDTTVTIAVDASAAAARGRLLLSGLADLSGTSRFMTEAEKANAYDKFIKNLETTEYPGRIKDISTAEVPLAGNSSTLTETTLTLGKVGGGGFINEKAANEFLGSIGRAGTAIQDESGQWFVRVKHIMPETGLYTLKLQPQATNIFSRYLRGARNTSDIALANQAQRAGNQNNALLKSIIQGYQKKFNALGAAERERLSLVLGKGQDQGVWLSEDGLKQVYQRAFNRLPSTAELEGYQAAIDQNDIGYAIRNDELFKFHALKGYETTSFDTGMGVINRRNALITEEAPSGMTRFYNMQTQEHMTQKAVTEEFARRAKNAGAQWVTLQEPVELADGTTIRHFLVKKGDMQVEPLRRDQLPYKPGLNRIYKQGQYFAKQTSMGSQKDTGTRFLRNPNTYMAGTRAEVDFWSQRMEAARKYYLGGKSGAEIDADIFKGHAGFETGDEFIKNMEAGVYDKEHEFGTYYDREMPKEYNAANDMSMVEGDESGTMDWLRTNGRLYYSPRGERLPDWNGANADVLDPFDTINRSLMNVASISSFSDYKLSAVERWTKSFRDFLNTKNLPDGASDYMIFRDGSVRGDVPNSVRQGIEAQRDAIKRILGWRTEQDLQSENFSRNLADWIIGDEPGSTRHKVGEALTDWFRTKNPIVALKGAAFDLKLGLFNIAQFPLQLSTAWAATMLDPVNGMKGFAMLPFLRTYMTQAGTDNLLDLMVKRGVPELGGFKSAEEFKAFMKTAKQSGFLNVGGAHEYSVDYGMHFGLPDKVQQLREAGRVFFNEPEVWNRIVAQRIAWAEAMVKHGGAWKTNEFKDFFAGRSEDYAFGMSKQSGAAWQKGLASIPTQFWAYNARMLEAMVGSGFTPAQKARLIIGQTLLYGSAGFPMAGVVSDMIKRHNGQSPGIDSFGGMLDRGLLDEAIFHLTGADVQVGKRYGTGNFLTDTVKDLFGWSSYGEKSVADVAGGAAISTSIDAGTALLDVARYAALEGGDESKPLTAEALNRVAMQVATYSNLTKAVLLAQYGQYVSNKGTVIAAGLPTQDAWAVALFGAQPGAGDNVSSMMEHLQDKKAVIDDAVKQISNMRARWANEPDNRADIEAEINTFVRLLPPDVRQQALRKAHNRTSPSVYDSLTRQIQREKAQAAVIQGLQQ